MSADEGDRFEVDHQRRRDGSDLYVARDPETPGPFGIGESEEEAMARLEGSLAMWREADTGIDVSIRAPEGES